MVGGLPQLREAANVFCAPIVEHSSELFALEPPGLVSVGVDVVAAYLFAKLCRGRWQVAPAWPTLHLCPETRWTHTVLAPVCHLVPNTVRFSFEPGLSLLNLVQTLPGGGGMVATF